jgi:hypothetical protein
MKRITALYAVTAIAALSIAGQAFAKSGGMGGNQGRSSMTSRMSTTQPAAGANSMQHGSRQNGAVQGDAPMQGAMTGTAAKGMMQSGVGDAAGHQSGMEVPIDKPISKQ